MAARFSVARAARQLTSSAAVRRPQMFVCQRWVAQPQPRLFSVSRALKEKKYTEDHEWIEYSADGKTATLGISTHAASALGDIVYIELPETGLTIEAGDSIGAIESTKSASDILSPVGGEVIEANEKLQDKPGDVNRDPEGEAWIAKIQVQGEAEGNLMSEAEYKAFVEEE